MKGLSFLARLLFYIVSFSHAVNAQSASDLPKPTLPLMIFDKDGWKVQFSGFVEMDVIVDSTRSLTELAGNAPIDPVNTANGSHYRTQFSARPSRLKLSVQPPEMGVWSTRGYFEMDFMGFQPSPGLGTTEASFYNNPTFRLRHAFWQADLSGLQILVGQTNEVFAWQPFYFISTEQVAPIASGANSRTPQIRVLQAIKLCDSLATLQIALAATRPRQRDGLFPDLQGGLRLSLNHRTSGFTGSSTNVVKTQPMSVAFSGMVRDITTPGPSETASVVSHVAAAVAVNVMIPILASSDNELTDNTLSLLSEFTVGSGYGDQFSGWTGNMASPLTSINLDAGIGDFDANGNFTLANLMTFNIHAQYHLPSPFKTFVNLGFGQLHSNNMFTLVTNAGTTSANKTPYNRSMVVFANLVHNFSDQIRMGLEYAYSQTGYEGDVLGFNHRYQMTTHFIF